VENTDSFLLPWPFGLYRAQVSGVD